MGTRYFNPHAVKSGRSCKEVLLWMLGRFHNPDETIRVPEEFSYPHKVMVADEGDFQILWFGHSTFLIEVGGYRFLTDPMLSLRASPLSWIGPKRRIFSQVQLKDLPVIDCVLISHDHYDHLDKATIQELLELDRDQLFCVPEGVDRHLRDFGASRIETFNWWDQRKICAAVSVTAVPAQHGSGRTPFDTDRTLWAGFVVKVKDKTFYFAGDTGYNCCDFKRIGAEFGPIDVAFIPSGCYIPRRFMSPVHASPQDAVKIHQEVRARHSVMMHHSTFPMNKECPRQMAYELFHAVQDAHLHAEDFMIPKIDQRIYL